MTEEMEKAMERACKMKLPPVRRVSAFPEPSEDERPKLSRGHLNDASERLRVARYVRVAIDEDTSDERSVPRDRS